MSLASKTDIINQGARIINSSIYGQLIFDNVPRTHNWGKWSLFNKSCWENWVTICKRMKLSPTSHTMCKNQQKWIKDLNVRSEAVKLLEENTL
jgi:hypothetical protein